MAAIWSDAGAGQGPANGAGRRHRAGAAPAAGYTPDGSRADMVSGHKRAGGHGSRLAIVLRPAGGGTEGTIAVSGE